MDDFLAAVAAADADLSRYTDDKVPRLTAEVKRQVHQGEAATAEAKADAKTEVKTEEETKVEKGLQFFDDFDDKWFWDAPLDIEQGGEYTIDDTEPPSPDAFVYKEEPEGDVEHRTGEHQPWSVRASHRGKSTDLSPEELNAVRAEQRSAEMCGMKWHERGPRGDGRPECWRGQTLRKGADGGKVRYANRGGKNKEYYAQLARNGKLVKIAPGKTVNLETKGKAKGKGKSEATHRHRNRGKGSGDGGKAAK